jgi:hypothetical protein
MRTPIQLTAVQFGNYASKLYVLCNDGSIWAHHDSDETWRRLSDVPQDAQPPGAGKAVELSPDAFTTYQACLKKF